MLRQWQLSKMVSRMALRWPHRHRPRTASSLFKSGRPDGVFHEVFVDLDSATFEIDTSKGQVESGKSMGLAKSAARQLTAGFFEEDQSAVQTPANRSRGDIGTCCIAGELRVLGIAGPLDGGANSNYADTHHQ
jgi:hypothetical protein